MPSRVLLHIGLHKTATTSIQDYLQANQAALAAAGVGYVGRKQWRAGAAPGKHSGQRLKGWMASCKEPVLMLSEENLIGVPRDFSVGRVYPRARKRIRSLLGVTGELPVDLVLVLRNPARFLVSIYCEYVRNNHYVPVESFLGQHDLREFSWRQVFDWLTDLPEQVRVHLIPFEPEFGGGVDRIVGQLLDCAGVDRSSLSAFPGQKSRSSYSAEEIAAAAELARRADAETASAFLRMLDQQGRRFGDTTFTPISSRRVAQLTERYHRDLLDMGAWAGR
ncbi:hypothetical protein F3N42_13080 [Marinihelvus fidelis]|uniref:Sulfotransferase family protein n=1 Tax=Marinihelvus fidelis TaxID=2613842 RepID=A0A5N0T8V4_9GAMM|nr:hypothetical protein [Marinihelvus fidelis]KAA9130266.1 hypothetical protein F3N42_13080 [Marinihelvus fidelis]